MTTSQTQRQAPPWDLSVRKLPQEREDAVARSNDPYFDPKDRSLFARAGGETSAQSQLAALLKSDTQKWSKVIHEAGIRVE